MTLHDVHIDEARLAAFCREHSIVELRLFGSITRESFDTGSDVDVLVEFAPGRKPDLWSFAGLEIDLSELMGREVHLHTSAMIPPRHADYFLRGSVRVFPA